MRTLDQALAAIRNDYPPEFLDLLRFVLPHECVFPAHQDGDYDAVLTEHDSRDPGGTTKFGLDAASHPHVEIERLRFSDAAAIYHADTWLPLQCDKITSEQVAISLADAAINCGFVRAVKWLQAAAQATQDGNLGPLTLHAANMMDGDELAKNLNDLRQHYYLLEVRPSLRAVYGKGWLNRLEDLRDFIPQFA
jgi:lysozyme family protein